MDKTTQQLTAAITDELRAEILVAYPNTKQFAAAADIDYGTLRRYLTGEREIKLSTLVDLLAVLDIRPSEFFARASARADR